MQIGRRAIFGWLGAALAVPALKALPVAPPVPQRTIRAMMPNVWTDRAKLVESQCFEAMRTVNAMMDDHLSLTPIMRR
jgi:hypothetical protein